jgi:hypothetical protein
MQTNWAAQTGWWATIAGGCALAGPPPDFDAYEAVNNTIVQQINQISLTHMTTYGGAVIPLRYFLLGLGVPSDPLHMLTGTYMSAVGLSNYTEDYVLGFWGLASGILETIRETLEAYGRDPAAYLFELMEAGQPPAEPAADFLKRAVKEFNHDEDDLIKLPFVEYGRDIDKDGEVSVLPLGIKDRFTGEDLGGETIYVYGYLDLDVSDDGILTIEVEYQDDQIDPKDDLRWLAYGFDVDGEDELEDYEVEFFGDDTVWKDGDTQFWVYGGVEQIPGYEVTVILGASAFAIMGLIYVVMKKRKK